MVRWWVPTCVAVVVVGLLAQPLPRASAVEVNGELAVLRQTATSTIDDKGDATINVRITYPTEALYLSIKRQYPNPYVGLRQLLGSGGKLAVANATVSYDDAKRCVLFTATQQGAAVAKRHRWQVDVGPGTELVHLDGHTAVLLNVKAMAGGTIVVSGKLELPAGAGQVKVDSDAGLLTYDLDRQPKAGTADVDVDLKVKPRLMSALYKVYADPGFTDGLYWTGKTLFTNNGTGDITHLKVRYKIGDYTQDWSPATEYGLVAPGGHVVDLYYPLLKAEVASLKSQAPVDLEVKYSYTDSAGKQVEDTTSKRITILGGNQFEYCNIPEEEQTGTWSDYHGNDTLEAAFVTKMDDPVRSLGGMAAQACQGQPAGASDEAAQLFCKALYELETSNNLSYQWSVGDNLGKGNSAQSLKYPRDVIRDKSGTCIELALTYAAVCESQGLHCLLVNIPGHCFPVVKLPSGQPMPVETTCISVAALHERYPKRTQAYSFKDAVTVGFEELNEMQQGPSNIVNVSDVQGKGVVCPELPALPANVMQSWGWKLPAAEAADRDGGGNGGGRRRNPLDDDGNGGGGNGGGGGGGRTANDNTPDDNGGGGGGGQADAGHPDAICGVWVCQFTGNDGSDYMAAEQLKKDGSYQMTVKGPNGSTGDKGTWMLDGGRNLVTNSSVTGTREVDQIQLNGDTLVVRNAERGFTFRMTRNR